MNYSIKLVEVLDSEYAVVISETINRKKSIFKITTSDKDTFDYVIRVLKSEDIYKIVSTISFFKGA